MQVIYYYDEPPESFSKSIFLAGPSPRTPNVKSWRPDALRILKAKGYDGVVYVPEPKPKNKSKFNEDDWKIKAPKWEHRMLDRSDVVLFWVPRDLVTLPGFTTNVEFGHWVDSGKAILGHPSEAPNIGYLRFMANKFRVPTLLTLEETIAKALEIIGNGALRTGGEREIPLFLWNTNSFQSWYMSQKKVGNHLDGARVEWFFKVGKDKDKVFYWAIHPSIYIASEKRNKTNEIVFSRYDISTIVLYKQRPDIMDSEIVLIREFRSPARTQDGFVWESAGGSSHNTTDALKVAAEEIREETGLDIESERLRYVSSRQLAATFSAHMSHLYCVELTDNELAWLKSQKNIPHGSDYPDNPTGERAYTEVVTLREIMYNNLVDFANVGMIRSVL